MSDSSARLEELLVEQTDRDLDYQETAEVQQLLRQLPEWSEDDVELAAAATLVAYTASRAEPLTEMPGSLREKISLQAQAHFLLENDEPAQPLARSDTIKRPPEEPRAEVISIFSRTRILIALAATIAAITVLGYYFLRSQSPAAGAGSVTIAWTAAGDALGKNATGGVVWSNVTQTGYMRFVGLPKNDKAELQYQLWIFDADRDERYPVDGGVFDVDSDGEVIVRIDPKIRVHQATMFAVTAERPGGVVVSTRERLVVLAKVI
jgi:hypothetical protein